MTEQNQTVVKGRAPTTGSILIKKKTRFQRWKGAIVGTALAASIVAGAIIGLRACGEYEKKECKTSCDKYEQVFKRKFEEKCVKVKDLRRGLPPLLEEPLVNDPKCKDGNCKEEKPNELKCLDDEVKVCLPVPEPVISTPKPEPIAYKPPPKKPICGDGKCEKPKENVNNCAEDCGKCGDGLISRSIGEKCEPPNKGCETDETCIGCRTCKPDKIKPQEPKCLDPRNAIRSDANAFATVEKKIIQKILASYLDHKEGAIKVRINACKLDTPGVDEYKLTLVSVSGINAVSLEDAKKDFRRILSRISTLDQRFNQSVNGHTITFE